MVQIKNYSKVCINSANDIESSKLFSGVKRGRIENETHIPLFSLTLEDAMNVVNLYDTIKRSGYPAIAPQKELVEAVYRIAAEAYEAGNMKDCFEFTNIAANLGLIEAIVMRAHRMLNGEGTKKDIQSAWKDFLFCAELGNTNAQATVAYHYLTGEDGIEKDLVKAKSWMKKAAANGSELASSVLEDWDGMVKFI